MRTYQRIVDENTSLKEENKVLKEKYDGVRQRIKRCSDISTKSENRKKWIKFLEDKLREQKKWKKMYEELNNQYRYTKALLEDTLKADTVNSANSSDNIEHLFNITMEQNFDYLRNVAFAATVCDNEGVIVYQNERSVERKGNLVGRSVYNCHKPQSQEIIRQMQETGNSHVYEFIKNAHRNFAYQTPWFKENGKQGGLIELIVDLPEEYPVFNRDKE